MQKIIERPFRAGWIPDFIQVFIEVMVRNKENEVMKPATLRSILSSLSEFTHSKETNPLVDSSSDSLLKSINNTFPFMFTLNTLMGEQNENWKVLDFQPYFTLIGEIITSKKKYFMSFPNLNDRISPSKEKSTRVEIEETEATRALKLEKLNNKRKNDSMRGFYRIRNFVENVFLVCHVLVDIISLPEDQIDDSNTNTFYVIWPKF